MTGRYSLRLVLVGSMSMLAACPEDTTPSGTAGSGSATSDGSTTTGGVTTFDPSSGTTVVETGDGSTTVAADDTSSDSTGPVAECGNGVLEGDEVCDGDVLSGETCESQGFDQGTLACAADCTGYDDSGCSFVNCGDNVLAGKEQCDGNDLGGASCASEGFDSGTLSCDARCLLDTGDCGTCGNVIVDGDEVCDDIVLFGQTCVSQGFDSGQLACMPDCLTYDTSGCGTCGNDLIDGDEDCDGMQLGGATCAAAGFDSGTVACGSSCAFDTEGCGLCGNGIVDGTELCDGNAVAGATCGGQGFDSGQLTCMPDCLTYDTSGCGICGNGILDGFEVCDDGNLVDGDGCPSDCGGDNRYIFVTSQMFNGNFGGLLGADAQCQALAVAAGLPGTYMAWLSTAAESPSTRMVQSAQPYVRPDGVQVAPNWAGLVDGTLDAPINVTELGGPPPIGNTSCAGGGFPTVWSSTTANGNSGGTSCADWTSVAGGGQWGRADMIDGSWSSWCFGGVCDWVSPIYCVQQ